MKYTRRILAVAVWRHDLLRSVEPGSARQDVTRLTGFTFGIKVTLKLAASG